MWDDLKKARKSFKDCWIGGVCGGLGAATPLPSWMWRALFLFALFAFGVGLLLYVVLWICMPSSRIESEQGAAPNGSPATRPDKSGITDGPPSVS